MTPQNEYLQTLTEQLGADAVARLCAIYGGRQIYIPVAPGKTATPTSVRMPTLCLRGSFDAQVPVNEAVQALAGAIFAIHTRGVGAMVLEVETTGIGIDYLERLQQMLSPDVCKVVCLTQAR